MSEALPRKPKTITRVNSRGLLEVVDVHTGRILCIQVSQEDLFEKKWNRLVEINTPEGPVWLEKGLSFDLTNKCMGMPFSKTLAGLIVDEIANGSTIISACKKINLTYREVKQWMRENEEFKLMVEEAEIDRADYLNEKIIQIGLENKSLDALKWGAERSNPEKFGPRQKISGDKESPLAIMIDTGIRREGDEGFPSRDVTTTVGTENGGDIGGEAPSSTELQLEEGDPLAEY